MPYVMYLRKSRKDIELDASGGGDCLERHRKTLLETAKRMHLEVTAIYEEVVSGDSIAARPQMQRLLSEVEQGLWDGVLVMEVERLARGDTIDQGIVAQAFKYSDTKIITPIKTYDPENEFDEEYFEFGLFMSRREYKTINRRLQRGRLASVNEGKYVGNRPPYGYQRIKLQGEKGFTLTPDEDAAYIIQNIFQWFCGGQEEMGVSKIVRRLNESGIPSKTGRDWTNAVVRGILANPVYAGFIRWGARATVKYSQDGVIKKSRPRAKEYTLVKGLHPALIPEELYYAAQKKLARNKSRPGPKQYVCKNPLAGLVYCADCGRAMIRRPYSERNGKTYPDTLMCPYTSCHNVSSPLAVVEQHILTALREWTKQYSIENGSDLQCVDLSPMQKGVASLDKEIREIQAQISRAYELVEQNVYTTDVFLQRQKELGARKAEAEKKKAALEAEIIDAQKIWEVKATIVPKILSILEAYPKAKTAEEKNNLLKSVLDHATYKKTTNLRWSDKDDMEITIFPKLPC